MNSRLLIILISLLVFTLSCSDGTIIELTSPDGGETWHEQTVQKIKWEMGFTVTTVDVSYSRDAGETWIDIEENFDGSEASWSLPSINRDYDSCLVKIVESDDETNYDISSNFFSIIADSTFYSITNPNGGEIFNEGDTISITWNSGGDISQDVNIYYSKDGGMDWNQIPNIGYYEDNDGIYSWTIPNQTYTSDSCLVKIMDRNNSAWYDISDSYFTITADSTFYSITNPNGGEIFNEGYADSITWSSGGDVSDVVKIYYSLDSGQDWITIDGSESNDGVFIWTPNLASSSGSSLIKIEDYNNSELYDISDSYFTLIADSTYYRITSPNGGESWEELSTHTITWESSGDAESENFVQLYYSIDSGQNWITIDTWEPNDGSYLWNLPELYVTSNNCRIKIQGNNTHIEDITNADFTITAGSGHSDIINVLSADGGEVWHEQTSEEITWYTTGDIGGNEVYIGYSTDGGNYWHDAVDDGGSNSSEGTANPPRTSYWDETSNNGSYSWSLPNFSDTLETCILGVWSATNTALYDMSDNYFTITCDSNYYRILQPNGGETFQKETDRYIFWESGGDVDDIEIYYSLFGGESWYLIDDYETNDGSFVWSVPSVQGTNDACKIKIQSRDRDDWFDISDANFTMADTVIFDFDMSFETGESLAGWDFEGNFLVMDDDDAFDGSRVVVCESADGIMSKTMTVDSGVMRFYYKSHFGSYSCNYDNLVLKIDGVEIFKVCGPTSEIDWTLVEYYVDAGTYDFEWEFEYSYLGYVKIDAISFP